VTDPTITSIDPGAWAGFARWQSFKLQEVGRLTDAYFFRGLGKCVIEHPMIYPMGKSSSRPNDIVKLAITAGRQSGPWEDVTWLAPHEWKGQVPDDILERRILAVLAPDEKFIVRTILEKTPKSYRHNLTDAIGIGLVFLKRMGRGGT
jgi:hypothetical protein